MKCIKLLCLTCCFDMTNIDFRMKPQNISCKLSPALMYYGQVTAVGNCHKNGRKPVSLGFNFKSLDALFCANTLSSFTANC